MSFLDLYSVYASETQIISGDIGAGWRHLGYHIVIFSSMMTTARIFVKPMDGVQHKYGTYFTIFLVCLAALAMQSINVGLSGLAFTDSRHQIWLSVPFPIIRQLFGILIIFIPFYSGYLVGKGVTGNRKKLTYLGLMLNSLYFIYLLASSQGFNGLVVASIYFLSPLILIYSNDYGSRHLRLSFRSVLSVIVLVPLLLLIGSKDLGERGISDITGGGWLANFAYRVTILQGSFYYSSDYQIWSGQDKIKLSSLIDGSKYMLDDSLTETYAEKSINVAGSIVGMAVVIFGFAGAVPFLVVFGAILGFLSVVARSIILRGHPIEVIVLSYLVLWISSVYQTGSIATVLSVKFYLFIFVLIVLRIMRPARTVP
ncbi:MAG: DUF6418 domain-containing protein [Halieaceae bacterium]|nr:DUF6418 domain-containing protein [Halieaceae bacterium]